MLPLIVSMQWAADTFSPPSPPRYQTPLKNQCKIRLTLSFLQFIDSYMTDRLAWRVKQRSLPKGTQWLCRQTKPYWLCLLLGRHPCTREVGNWGRTLSYESWGSGSEMTFDTVVTETNCWSDFILSGLPPISIQKIPRLQFHWLTAKFCWPW